MSSTKNLLRLRLNLVIAYSLIAALALAIPSSRFLRGLVRSVLADTAPQTLPFSQNWTNTGLITTNDSWAGVPGIIGYRGDDLTLFTATDPQTILVDGSATPVDVNANQTDPSLFNTGGVTEFELTNPTIALTGSGTGDAPHIVIALNTTGQSGINVSYNLRDIDGSTDNAIQPVALQYRVGASGNFTNLPAGFVADASSGPSLATLVTPVSVNLPAACDNQPIVHVRIITTNAVGNDEFIGVDDISITSGAGPVTPALSINDVTQAETNAGTITFTFTVSLSAPAQPGGVTFDIATADGTAQDDNPATEDNDYVAKSETGRTITVGNSTASFTVTVNGDATTEPNETFFVNVTNITGASVGDVQGLGTISNDDVATVAVHDIQGSGSTSPLVSTTVTTTGIVTGLRSNGFFLQTPDAGADANPETSEGIFVFTSSAPPAAAVIGNSVNVTGTVQEFIPSQDLSSPPATELITPTVVLLSTGNPLPVPILITAAETTQASETSNPLDSLEEYEGMRVKVASLTVSGATQGSITEPSATVSSTGVFIGVVTSVARPFREPGIAISDPLPAGAPVTIPRFDENPERIRVDSDAQPGTTALDVAAGTVITNITGPLDYAFRVYTIVPDLATPPSVGVQPGSTPAPIPTANEFTVVSFNMERFFDTVNDPSTSDPVLTAAALDRRLAKASLIVRTVERYPDVIGVEEMENLTTLQAVAAKINSDAQTLDSLPNPNYTAYLSEGNDIGGIDNGFLVKQSRISVVDVTQFGLATTYPNPDSSTSILNDRPPLVLRATCPRPLGGTRPFTVIVNHLRSLSGVDDNGPGSSGFATEGERVRFKRRAQAEYLANLIQARQVSNPNELIITVGDMNAFNVNDGYVDSIGTIKGTPAPASQVTLASSDLVSPDLTNLIDALPAAQQYSYNFDGNAQTLDHIIVNQRALTFLSRFAYARNDSDFPVKHYESTNELRISDHDQPVAYFNLGNTAPTANAQSVTTNANVPVAITLTGSDTDGDALTFTIVSGPTHGALNPGTSGASQTYTPTAGYSGPDSFTFKVNDGVVDSAPATVSITIDPAPGGVVRFSSATFDTTESSGSATITVQRVGDTSQVVFVDYATSDDSGASTVVPCTTANGTASSRCDFTTSRGRLGFATGEGSKTFTVPISQDNFVEGLETLTLTLSNATGSAVLGTPSSATLRIADDASEPVANPIDDADVFVRQHYHDFLNREADASGLAFWTNQITSCGADAACREIRRINVSAAFFLSIEFQESGTFVRNFYVAALNRPNNLPRFLEFLLDTQAVQRGVIIGEPNAFTLLEANKQAFAVDFVTRSEFVGLYPTTATPTQYVDALYLHAAVTPSAAERQAAIDEFGGAGTSADTAARVRALRRIIQNTAFTQREFPRAFVQMEYFGYLRRNPDDQPDGNLNGYNFWLNKLNQFNGNFVQSDMVKAFINSGEYRNRFGQ